MLVITFLIRRLSVSTALLMVAATGAQPLDQERLAGVTEIRILSPEPDSYVSGPTRLRAHVEPRGSARAVAFFVDGRQVCVVTRETFECDWDAGATVAEHQVRAVAVMTPGGRVVTTVRTKGIGYTERVDVDVVQVTVTVIDRLGRFVAGLPQSAFRIFEDGRPEAISHFGSEALPLDLVVAVDISGSMTPAMPQLKKAVKAFLGAVPSHNLVTLLAFNDTVFTLNRRTTDLSERVKAVDRLAAWGSTALYDVILRGVDMLGRQTGRKAIVVFTDGEDQGSHATIADVEHRLQASDVTLYMIGLGRGLTMESQKKVMQRLTTPTGGRTLLMVSVDELQIAFDDLLDELSHQYLLSYPPTNATRDGAWRSIRVDVDGRYQVRARQGYRASQVK
jgi:Ca-activated chloride channel family protein